MFLLLVVVCVVISSIFPVYAVSDTQVTPTLKTLVSNVIALRPTDGKIDIPISIKHIKLDIGLSYSAPMSHEWLTKEDDLLVFGFEPNPAAVHSILQGAVKQHESHGTPLDTQFIGKRFFLIPCALGLLHNTIVKFFVTAGDCGCSSIYKPRDFPIERIIEVPIFTLADFFDLFPFDTHPVIDYIKIDAQGADLDIVKSAGKYLAERVIYITIEAENDQYEGTVNTPQAVNDYMISLGFISHRTAATEDLTYFNLRYTDYIKDHAVRIYQRG
jgi:FkbM family methyltransferase